MKTVKTKNPIGKEDRYNFYTLDYSLVYDLDYSL